MAAANTDKFTKVGAPGTATTMEAPGHLIGGTEISVVSTTNWETDTGVVFAIDTVTIVNGKEVRSVGSYTEWIGVVTGATTISSMILLHGSDQNYSAGATTRVYIPVSSSRENRIIDGLLVTHDQDGALKTGAVSEARMLASNVVGTTKIINGSVDTTKIANGNVTAAKLDTNLAAGWIDSEETWTYASASTFTISGDKTSKYSVGMKLKFTQTTVKYGVITAISYSAPDTTVTIAVWTAYALVNAAITLPFFSYSDKPQGMPDLGTLRARAYLTAGQTIADNTTVKVTLNAESYDPNSDFDAATNYRYVAPMSGYYCVNAQVSIADGESKISSSYGRLTKNQTAIVQNYQLPCFGSNTANGITHTISDIIYLVAGEYLELTAWADTTDSGSVVVTGGATMTYLSAHLLST